MKSILLRQTGCCLLAVGLFFSAHAQTSSFTPVSIDAFQLTGNWQKAQSVQMHPQKANVVKSTPGNTPSILIGKGNAEANFPIETSDLILKLEFMLAPSSEATLQLPEGHIITLADSWLATPPICGSLQSLLPLQNAAKAPGLWQNIFIEYKQATSQQPAQIEKMILNGTTIYENVFLAPTTSPKNNSISWKILNGLVALRHVGYQLLNDRKPLKLQQMTYSLYKGWAEKPDQINAANLIKKDTTSLLTQEWGLGERNFYIIYEGQMEVADAGDYTFEFPYKGHLIFEIDGQNKIPSTWNEFLQKPVTTKISLSKGNHPFRLHYHKVPWRDAALGINVSKAGVRPYSLHVPSSLPAPDPIPRLEVRAANSRAELIRSFVQMEGEKTKRTHALSVGTPQNVHYTIDLNRASLLQYWKGDFADVTDMWYERGEPQILQPMGAAIVTKGQTDIAALANTDMTWPDSSTSFVYKGYQLNASGVPTITYFINGVEVSDQIQTDSKGLVRTITANLPNGFVRLAAAKNIVAIDRGLYAIDDQRYYVQIDPKAKPILRNSNGQQELLMPLQGTVRYSLIW